MLKAGPWQRVRQPWRPGLGVGERTLRDGSNYITKLPKREHDTPAWRAAIEALMLVAN